MSDKHVEWFKQADYDMDTADAMYLGGRYFYAVFMCHLSIEKALKGLFSKVLADIPPKTHNLLYLLKKTGKKPGEELEMFLIKLNEAAVATRYPEDLAKIQASYTEEVTKDIISKSKGVLRWIKTQL